MKLEKIFENDYFIIYKDNKGYDFVYDIENKQDKEITIFLTEYEEEITIKKWLGLFESDFYIIENIINGNFEIKEV